MSGNVSPAADERAEIINFLGQQRKALRVAAHGLTDDEGRLTPTRGSLSIGGLVKHVASTEQGWADRIRGEPAGGGEDDYVTGFVMTADETLDGLLAHYASVASATDATLAEVDLDRPVPVPKGVPWFPSDIDAWSVRWIAMHLIEETARHAGHADIVRESIDGATAMPLMAAAEGWPASSWLTPWKRA